MSPSSSTASFSTYDSFTKTWREFLSFLNLTYAVLVSHTRVVERVRTLLRDAEPVHLPENHPFCFDYNEFVVTFDHGLASFQANLDAINAHRLAEHEIWCKSEEIGNSEAMYNIVSTGQNTLHTANYQLSDFHNAVLDSSRVIDDRRKKGLGLVEREEDHISKAVQVNSSQFLDPALDTVRSLHNWMSELGRTNLEMMRRLEQEKKRLEVKVDDLEEPSRATVRINEDLETRLRSFWFKFIQHLGLTDMV